MSKKTRPLHVATVAYVIAYVGTYGGGGYLSLGGQKHIHVFTRAAEVNRTVALETLGDELGVKLAANSYNVGVTRHLIQLLSAIGEFELAQFCWSAAYKVIKFRLPSEQFNMGVFIPFDPNHILAWSVNENIVAIILGRLHHPILQRKIAALFGFAQAIKRCPLHVMEPLKYFLTHNTTTSSMMLILDTLLQVEKTPYDISNNISEILLDLSRSELWGIRVLASELLSRIGIVIQSVNYSYSIQPLSTLSERDNNMLTWISGGNIRHERLIALWPELLEFTWARFKQLYRKGTVHDELSRRDARLEFGRDGTSYPPTPVLRWESEIFETALNDTLNGLPAYLWRTGQRETITDRQVVKEIMPASKVHVGLHASRIPRPAYPNPEDLTERLTDVLQLKNDPLYSDWCRLGYWERHWLSNDQKSYGQPDQVATIYSGLVIEFDHLIPEDNVFPLNDFDVENWWSFSPNHKKRMLFLMRGQLIGISRVTDWLGDALILIPPPELIEKLDLRFAKPFKQIKWIDSKGNPGVVLRTWQIRDKRQYQGEPLEFKGSDLIMRPDLFNKLKHSLNYPVYQLSIMVQTERNIAVED